MLIYLIGMPGSGKTTLGIGLAKSLGISLVDMDKEIEDREQKSIPSIFANEGESYFREIEQLVLHEVSKQDNVVISTGGGSPCFYDNINYMNQHGKTIFIDVSAEELAKRMKTKGSTAGRPLLQGKQNDALLQELKEKLTQRYPFYNQADKTLTGDSLQVADLKKCF